MRRKSVDWIGDMKSLVEISVLWTLDPFLLIQCPEAGLAFVKSDHDIYHIYDVDGGLHVLVNVANF